MHIRVNDTVKVIAGADKEVMCIKVLGGTRKRTAGLGDVIVCSVKSVVPGSDVKKKAVVRAVIVRCKAPTR